MKVRAPADLLGAGLSQFNSAGYAGAVFSLSIDDFEQIVNSRYDEANLKVRNGDAQ